MNTSAVNISATTIRYDLLPELTDLLIGYTGKREEIENFLGNAETDPFTDPAFQINGITVSLDAVKLGLQAELSAMELKLENRFNIIVGRPLPKVQPWVANEEAVERPTEEASPNTATLDGTPVDTYIPSTYSSLPEA